MRLFLTIILCSTAAFSDNAKQVLEELIMHISVSADVKCFIIQWIYKMETSIRVQPLPPSVAHRRSLEKEGIETNKGERGGGGGSWAVTNGWMLCSITNETGGFRSSSKYVVLKMMESSQTDGAERWRWRHVNDGECRSGVETENGLEGLSCRGACGAAWRSGL